MIFINQVLEGDVEDDVNTEDDTFQQASGTPHSGFITASSEVLQGRTPGAKSWSPLASATQHTGCTAGGRTLQGMVYSFHPHLHTSYRGTM